MSAVCVVQKHDTIGKLFHRILFGSTFSSLSSVALTSTSSSLPLSPRKRISHIDVTAAFCQQLSFLLLNFSRAFIVVVVDSLTVKSQIRRGSGLCLCSHSFQRKFVLSSALSPFQRFFGNISSCLHYLGYHKTICQGT